MKTLPNLCTILVLLLISCSPTKAYRGPELTDQETSTIQFFGQDLELSNMAVDGLSQGLFDLGVKVVPGTHSFFANFKKVTNDCSFVGSCWQITTTGSCSGSITSGPGKTYAVRVRGYLNVPALLVEEKDSGQISGSGICKTEHESHNYEPEAREK